MADLTTDPGQVTAIATETLHGVALLSPAAQTAAVVAVALVAGLWIWTRRPKNDADTLKTVLTVIAENTAVIAANTTATNKLSDRVDQVVELNATILDQNAVLIAEIAACRGMTPPHAAAARVRA